MGQRGDDGRYRCAVCNKPYGTTEALRCHVYHPSNRECRDGIDGQQRPLPGAAGEVRTSQDKLLGRQGDDGRYRCCACNNTYGTPEALRSHVYHPSNETCRRAIDGNPMTL